jgi:hypothetical protein
MFISVLIRVYFGLRLLMQQKSVFIVAGMTNNHIQAVSSATKETI